MLGRGHPVTALVSATDRNRGCVAVDQVMESVGIVCGVIEDQACMRWRIDLPAGQAVLRFDLRDAHLATTLQAVAAWWETAAHLGPRAQPVDQRGRVPLYSTWYAYRQGISAAAIEAECALAAELGMHAVIVDDGWQQDLTSVVDSMAVTGTWQPRRLVLTRLRRVIISRGCRALASVLPTCCGRLAFFGL